MDIVNEYLENGYSILKNTINFSVINNLLMQFCVLANTESGKQFNSPFDETFVQYLKNDAHFESYVYNKIRDTPYLKNFIYQSGILKEIKKFFPQGFYLLEKIVFRIDLPLVVHELAVWHQDNYYVQGSKEIITAWIPMQTVNYANGCLSVMPKSHLSGLLPHTQNVLSKKFFPESIFHHEIRYIEMNVGDCLLFHALLLHSGNLNLSPQPRYSIQARFSPFGQELPPQMGLGFLVE